jgi:dTDP-4-dehydrorhamnose 3,5-epimerase-like enzyme
MTAAANQPDEVRLIEGGTAVDERGVVSFVNDFDFRGVKRFYTVASHRVGAVRAWHAHRREAKYVTVVRGSALVGAVKIDNWERPSPQSTVHSFVLEAARPAVVAIPAGYANGFMSLTADTLAVFFSTATLEESLEDDIRYDARYWDIWQVK